ncbi:rhodanese-like domain-containing protein [Paenibacillus pinistramenti]|uniref:rhodanese-like domain-containing protein n=1 Tax=Paenibacillus pinistramenti TaxID=1768003 RepID=UPI0011092E24|nr:rhodanese-like domain-containing protein [Paenibacillus pinistramenti]
MSKMIYGVPHVDADELQQILDDKVRGTIVIDVREPYEYIAGHIPTVPLIPMGEIAEYADDMDKEREYVFICRSGQRSLNVARYFQELGFTNILNYEGGMLAWDKAVVDGPENIIEDFTGMDQLERK